MKIGFLLPTVFASHTLFRERIFAPGPLARDTVNGLVKRGHEVWVFSTPDFKTEGKLVAGDIEPFAQKLPYDKLKHAQDQERRIRYDEVWKRSFEISMVATAFATAKKERFDIMHSYHDFLFTPHYMEDVADVPTVYTLHDPLPPEGSFEYHEFKKFAKHRYVSISNAQRRGSLALDWAGTVYHGLNVSEFPFEQKTGDYLLFMGRLIPEKGLDQAIAAALATKTKLEIGTHFPGKEKETPYYIHQIKPYLTSPLIAEPGMLADEEKKKLYQGAKALLFPIGWEEPFGMVMIEAMATGTPVIAYNRGSVAEIIKDGVTGFIVEPEESGGASHGSLFDSPRQSPVSIAPSAASAKAVTGLEKTRRTAPSWVIRKRGIEGLIEAIGRIGEIDREACRNHVQRNFTLEKMVEGYEQVYRKILEKH